MDGAEIAVPGSNGEDVFPSIIGKWLLDIEMDKMAITTGRHHTLFRPFRCPDNGVHATLITMKFHP